MLLKLFTAVVLGGVAIGGGRGTPVGAIFGALILTALTNILLISGVRTYYVPVVEGIVLLVAVLAFSASRSMPVSLLVRHILHGGRRRAKPSAVTNGAMLLAAPGLVEVKKVGWQRHIPFLRMVVPAIVLCLIAVGATAIVSGSGFSFASYFVSMLVFASFLAVVGLGQGAVVISGGLDLSVAWTITLPAVIITTFSSGLDASIVWVVPLALAVGAGVGVLNGALVVGCGISPIIVTLGVAGILEGLTLVVSGGAPTGYVPPALSAFVNGSFLGLQPLLWFMLVFCVGAFLLINRSVFGHRLIAVGNSVWASRLSGIRTGTVLIGAYGLSGLCAAITGVLLAGFNGQANYDMGRPYLLASIAVVVLGGTDIRGGRGHYTGILAGALLFTSLSSMLSATTLPEALRSIIYGVVLIAAVLFMRDKN
jgi:ribose transport system permease protein